jgi:hypothetical protein
VLAPNAKWRREIISTLPEPATKPANDHAHVQGSPARMSWARLLKRVFDIEHCPNCGGSLKIIACPEASSKGRAAIEDPPVIVKILSHLGLPDPSPAARASASSRSIPDNLSSRKPPANASRRRRSL